MLNYIWCAFVAVAVLYGAANGKMAEVSAAVVNGAGEAVEMTVSLAGIMCFWTGIMNIAKKAKLTEKMAKLLNPLMKLIFPNLSDSAAKEAIVMNITANMFGMSNAATPLGIKAVERLWEISDKKHATDEMCMFIVLNTASVQLIPTTVIAMRSAAGSALPSGIITSVWVCSLAALFVGTVSAKLLACKRV